MSENEFTLETKRDGLTSFMDFLGNLLIDLRCVVFPQQAQLETIDYERFHNFYPTDEKSAEKKRTGGIIRARWP